MQSVGTISTFKIIVKKLNRSTLSMNRIILFQLFRKYFTTKIETTYKSIHFIFRHIFYLFFFQLFATQKHSENDLYFKYNYTTDWLRLYFSFYSNQYSVNFDVIKIYLIHRAATISWKVKTHKMDILVGRNVFWTQSRFFFKF